MSTHRTAHHTGIASLGVATSLTVFGCALFDTGGWTAPDAASQAHLVRKPESGQALPLIQCEYHLIERPVGDPLLGNLLWDELDQIGPLDVATRRELDRQGFRVGIASSHGPVSLQKLLGEATELIDHKSQEEARRLRSHRLTLRSGGDSEAQTSDLQNSLALQLPTDASPRTLAQARCIFRVTAAADQPGWVTLDMLPEIHHGMPKLRTAADATGWQLRSGQEIIKLYPQRFRLTLNEGEMAVVTVARTSGSSQPESLGRHFFLTTSEGVPIQRLLVLRLVSSQN